MVGSVGGMGVEMELSELDAAEPQMHVGGKQSKRDKQHDIRHVISENGNASYGNQFTLR